MAKTPNDVEQAIVEACRAGMSGRAAAKRFGISPSSVTLILRRHSVPTQLGRPRTCELDEHAFDEITPVTLYWTGFLMADGGISDQGQGQPEVILELSESDRLHVEKFRTFLKSTHKISRVVHRTPLPTQIISEPRYSAAFRVRSTQIAATLLSLGMTLRKTDDRIPTGAVADSPDFWRGGVDGDGTVAIYTRERTVNGRIYTSTYPFIMLSGQRSRVQIFEHFLARHGITGPTIGKTASGIFKLQLTDSKALAVIRLLYRGAPDEIALERKFAIATEIMEKW